MRKLFYLSMLLLGACGVSPENHYYTLSAVETAGRPSNIALDQVTIPGLLDRPQIVMKSGANKVTILEYQRWAEPLDSMTKRVLAEDLHASATQPLANARKVRVSIEEFTSDETGHVLLRATWTSQIAKGGALHRFEKTESTDASTDAIVAAMSRLLNELAGSIAQV